MADLEKITEEQLADVSGGKPLTSIGEKEVQRRMLDMSDAQLQLYLSSLSGADLQKILGSLDNAMLLDKIKRLL